MVQSRTDAVAVATRLLTELDELHAAERVVAEIWGPLETPLISAALLRAYTHYGNPVIGAFVDGELCGVSIGFLAAEPSVHLHSHITGVRAEQQHRGVGYELKRAQQEWCAARGIDLITWTFDPLRARNAYFNLHKLGAVATAFLPNFYGRMDDSLNRGEDTDRLEVSWRRDAGAGDIVRTVAVPRDYDEALASRATICEQLADAFAAGLVAVDFTDDGYSFARA